AGGGLDDRAKRAVVEAHTGGGRRRGLRVFGGGGGGGGPGVRRRRGGESGRGGGRGRVGLKRASQRGRACLRRPPGDRVDHRRADDDLDVARGGHRSGHHRELERAVDRRRQVAVHRHVGRLREQRVAAGGDVDAVGRRDHVGLRGIPGAIEPDAV